MFGGQCCSQRGDRLGKAVNMQGNRVHVALHQNHAALPDYVLCLVQQIQYF